jgi:hypothetical protein
VKAGNRLLVGMRSRGAALLMIMKMRKEKRKVKIE